MVGMSEFENNVLKGVEISYPNDVINFGKAILECLENHSDCVGLIVIAISLDNGLDQGSARTQLAVHNRRTGNWVDEACRHRMDIVKPKMVFVSQGSVAAIADAVGRAELDAKIIVFGSASEFLDFDRIIAQPGIEEVKRFVCVPIESLEGIALILFTSGSTGPPKGIALTHGSLIQQQRQSEAFGISGHVCLSFLTPDWMCAISTGFMHIFLKVPRIITPEFDESSACALIEKHRATWIILTPTMINRLLKYSAAQKYDLSSVTKVIHGGSSLSVPSYNDLAKLLPNADIFAAYGTSEVGSNFPMQTKESKPGSCGQLLPNAQLKVTDIVTGKTLGVNQQGELLLKGPFMMPYYYNNPQATAQAFDEEGRLFSGDFGYYDEDGEVFVIDRIKEIIRCADDDICPSDIESVVLPCPGVKEAAVVGQPRNDEENVLVIFVTRTETPHGDGKQVTEKEILDIVPARIRSYKRLRIMVEFIEEIPKTRNYKIRRLALRELARSIVEI